MKQAYMKPEITIEDFAQFEDVYAGCCILSFLGCSVYWFSDEIDLPDKGSYEEKAERAVPGRMLRERPNV